MNAPESTSPSIVISPISSGKYSILLLFLRTMVEWRGIYVSPSFSVTYSLIELFDLGKMSGKIDTLLESWVSSLVCCGAGRSSEAFSFGCIWFAMESSLLFKGAWVGRFTCCLGLSL